MRKKEHRPPFTFCVVISSKKDKQNLKSICCILCRITRVTETFKFHFNNTVIVSAKYKFYHKFVGFVFFLHQDSSNNVLVFSIIYTYRL